MKRLFFLLGVVFVLLVSSCVNQELEQKSTPNFSPPYTCEVSSCSSGVKVLNVEDSANSHAGLSTSSNYSSYVCCDDGVTGSFNVGADYNPKVFSLSEDNDNSHIGDLDDYSTGVGFEGISCEFVDSGGYYSVFCDGFCVFEILSSDGGTSNGHVYECGSISDLFCQDEFEVDCIHITECSSGYNSNGTISGCEGDYLCGVCTTTEGGIIGCMDPLADNYNPDATVDEGSCEYTPNYYCNQVCSGNSCMAITDCTDLIQAIQICSEDQEGTGCPSSTYCAQCIDVLDCNYDDGIINPDEECDLQFTGNNGCPDDYSCTDECICVEGGIYGCMDETAINYEDEATIDDGNCYSCSDGISNGEETGIDCGGDCGVCGGTINSCEDEFDEYSDVSCLEYGVCDGGYVFNDLGTISECEGEYSCGYCEEFECAIDECGPGFEPTSCFDIYGNPSEGYYWQCQYEGVTGCGDCKQSEIQVGGSGGNCQTTLIIEGACLPCEDCELGGSRNELWYTYTQFDYCDNENNAQNCMNNLNAPDMDLNYLNYCDYFESIEYDCYFSLAEDVPFFDSFSILLTLILLSSYYLFNRKQKVL